MGKTRNQTVLVTGANGTVGNYVLGLAEANGYRVIANDLTATGIRKPVHGEVRAADLRDDRDIDAVVRGCDVVIHTAAQLDVGASAGELARTNTEAVARLYEAAERAGASRFIHMSTAMLYSPGQSTPLSEQSRIAPRGPHGMSKHGAEAYLRGRGEGSIPRWTIVRAAPIYGRRGRHFSASLLAAGPMLRLSTPVLPALTGGPVGTMVHAEDVARALLFLADHAESAYRVFNVADEEPLPLGDRLTLTFRAYGLTTGPSLSLPRPALSGLGRAFQVPGVYRGADVGGMTLWQLVVLRHGLKPALRPRLDREGVTLLYDDFVVDATAIRSLGFRCRFPHFSEGWREVLRWYQAERWVPRYA